jgi:hypothetical protein
MGKYKTFGSRFDRVHRNDLNANFADVEADINAQKNRVDNLIAGTPQPSEVVDSRGGFPVLRDRLDNLSSDLAQKANKTYVTPEDYGAKGDGVTNDSVAFQSAFDYGFANNVEIKILSKRYKVSNPIILKEGNYTVIGEVESYTISSATPCILAEGSLFKGLTSTTLPKVKITLSKVNVLFTEANNCCVFENINLYNSDIHNNSFWYASYFVKGSITKVSKIYNNSVKYIKVAFMSDKSVIGEFSADSFIENNLITGNHNSNPTFIDAELVTYFTIANNYIDFFKFLVCNSNSGKFSKLDINFSNNIIDFFYRLIGSNLPTNEDNTYTLNFNNNTFSHFSKVYIDRFLQADAEMIGNNWGVVYGDAAVSNLYITNIAFNNNKILDVDYFIYCDGLGRFHNIVENNTTGIANITTHYYYPYYFAEDGRIKNYTTTKIGGLNGQVLTAYQNIYSSAKRVRYFDGQSCVLNNKTIISRGLKWYDLLGNEVTS